MDFATAQRDVLTFRDERDWAQFHTPKDLAISVAIEAGELLECFQWTGKDVTMGDNKRQVREELADVLIYCMYLADAMGADVPQLIEDKIEINKRKYPVTKAKGSSKKYTELEFLFLEIGVRKG